MMIWGQQKFGLGVDWVGRGHTQTSTKNEMDIGNLFFPFGLLVLRAVDAVVEGGAHPLHPLDASLREEKEGTTS